MCYAALDGPVITFPLRNTSSSCQRWLSAHTRRQLKRRAWPSRVSKLTILGRFVFSFFSFNYELWHWTPIPEWEAFYFAWWLTRVLLLRLNRFDYNDFSGGYLRDADYPRRCAKFPRRKQNPFDYVLMACGNEPVEQPASELKRSRDSRHRQFIFRSLFISCCCLNRVVYGRMSKMNLIALTEREAASGACDIYMIADCC